MNRSKIYKNNILVIYWRVPLLCLIFAYCPLLQYEHLFSIQLSNHNVVIYMITAKAWILIDVKQNRVLRGKALQEQTEIASLTKMYTLYSCLTLNQTLRINPQSTVVKTFQTSITGTSAKILPNRYISLIDLYYGLMLPSGNDVACMLACYYGFWLANAEEMQGQPKQFRKQSIGQRMKYYELYCKKFVQYMNNKLVKQELKHTHTRFQNPHGLSDKNHVSTVSELCEASLRFIKNATFSKICACQSYQGNYYQSEDTFEWANTNILLKEGYTGIKTGNTLAAGGCLSSIIEISLSKYEKIQLLIVLVGSADQNSRFEQTRIIVEEYLKYLKMMKL